MPRHPNSTSIKISAKTKNGRPLTDTEIAANRERLAQKIAAVTHAIVLPNTPDGRLNGRPGKEITIMPRGIPGNNKLFEVAEMNVAPPPPPADRRYAPLADTILSAKINGDGRSEWMRFLFPTRRAASGDNTRLSRKERPAWRAEGHDIETALVAADDNKCWLYVRRIRVIGPSQEK